MSGETLPDAPAPNTNSEVRRESADGGDAPRQKRIACVVCRKRKLKCDGARPACGTCSRLGHNCSYDEVRRKSGPKRGYVKALEARLAQVETLLKTQDGPGDTPPINKIESMGAMSQHSLNFSISNVADFQEVLAKKKQNEQQQRQQAKAAKTAPQAAFNVDDIQPFTNIPDYRGFPETGMDHAGTGGFGVGMQDPGLSWEMVQLGIDEALPDQHIIDDLHDIYFSKVAPYGPIIHKGRYLASLDLAPQLRAPICLRYAIWMMAASVSDQYSNLQTVFYRRARKYAEEAEMKGHGEHIVSVQFAQTWGILATYEYRLMYFPRAWMSAGRSVKLCQMLGLNRLDGVGLDVKQCIAPPKDWTELEERRRTFWIAFCTDRYASIGTGWPMQIDERDIMTHLPSSDEAFASGRATKSYTLKEALTPGGAPSLSSYAGVIIMAALIGRNLLHLHRPDEGEDDSDYEKGEFWRRHRHMDNILLNTVMSLPPHFKLPNGIMDPNIVFTNMNIHTCTICLHQAAIFKADKFKLPSSVSKESKYRCVSAAAQITAIMKMIGSQDMTAMNPFVSFCLYVAARVFVQYLKSNPNDENIRSSLDFLISAMGHLKKLNPLTESFLVQLDVDMIGSMDTPSNQAKFPYGMKKGVVSECFLKTLERGLDGAEIYVPRDGKAFDGNTCTPSGSSNTNGKSPSEAEDPPTSSPFFTCNRTIMNITIEKAAREKEAQRRGPSSVSPTSTLGSNHTSPSMDLSGSNEHSSHTSPSNNSGLSPIEEMVTISSHDYLQQQHQPPQTTSLSGFDFGFVPGVVLGTGTGLTPKEFSNPTLQPDAFDISSLTVEQQDAMFTEMLAMNSPSQWMNGSNLYQ
ncbi:hypothetical protein TWF102_001602 [Orbilia oligospora]|uniref:Zn(2)-C6 fungal-type domain-containing protein n=2 Tax=Orbilia oligospora TaxID=2813651 RepID=A0A7C8NH70_ORBOL|nr:hypothetical protein TWF706_002491 [Orbilia oligospora]KAF3081643.1 hypothetical protein TWF102_001602 [Orbilia oligospora]